MRAIRECNAHTVNLEHYFARKVLDACIVTSFRNGLRKCGVTKELMQDENSFEYLCNHCGNNHSSIGYMGVLELKLYIYRGAVIALLLILLAWVFILNLNVNDLRDTLANLQVTIKDFSVEIVPVLPTY